MFNGSDFIKGVFESPEQIWRAMDTFWHNYTDTETENTVRQQSIANLLLFLNSIAKNDHFWASRSAQTATPTWSVPWQVLILYEDQLKQGAAYEYGDPIVYGGPILYGQLSGTEWRYDISLPAKSFGYFADSVTDTTVVIEPAWFRFDASLGTLIFTRNPFLYFPTFTEASTGRKYMVLWARNVELDLSQPFDQLGWVAGLHGASDEKYCKLLNHLWRLVVTGPSIAAAKEGIMDALGLPRFQVESQLRYVFNDTVSRTFASNAETSTGLLALGTAVAAGSTVQPWTSLTSGATFREYNDLMAASAGTPIGIPITHVFNDGTTAELVFANQNEIWQIDNAVSPFDVRFNVGGEVIAVEKFWDECYQRQVSSGVDLQTLLVITGPGDVVAVNPMKFYLGNLLKYNIWMISLSTAALSNGVADFFDRARQYLSPSAYILLEHYVGDFADALDLDANTLDTVGYGYYVDIPTEVISVAATDLVFFDLTPMVTCA